MNDELWNLMPMDPIQNMQKNKKLPAWNDYFEQFANNQFIMYELIQTVDKDLGIPPRIFL